MTDIGSFAARSIGLALALTAAGSVHASDRWEEAALGAVAILPAPRIGSPVVGGSLYCQEQKWGLLLRTEAGAIEAGSHMPVTIAVGGETQQVSGVAAEASIHIPVPREILDPIKAANLMTVTIGEGDAALKAGFPLRGSRKVVEAIAPRCSPIDMSAYEEVTLSETGINIGVASDLRADESRLFRAFTGNQPVIAANTFDLSDGKALLFASLCGSKSYYGPSGCSLAGYARMTASGDWRQVYETEGVRLYLDRAVDNGGFPDVMTLPVIDGLQSTRWSWTGADYAVGGDQVAEQEKSAD